MNQQRLRPQQDTAATASKLRPSVAGMALSYTQRLSQLWATILLWFRDTLVLVLSWLPFDTSFIADTREHQRRKGGKRILGRSGSSSGGSPRASRSVDASGTAPGSGGATPRRSRRLKGLAPAQGGSGPSVGGSSSSSGIPSSSSSSSESDQVTDSDSNTSDASHMRQLGRLRAGGSNVGAAGGASQRQAGRSRRSTPNGSGISNSGGSPRQSHVHRSPTAHRLPRKTLVLDLDETLIHSTSRGARNYHHMVEVLVERHVFLYYVYKRPYCDLFLKKVCEWYKVVIFTASMPEYADPVIDWLDPGRNLFAERYFRQSCMYRNGLYVKDLSIIEPDLARVCLVDNSPISYQWNEDNGIPIETWQTDTSDEALLDMLPFLDALRYVEDVRHILAMK
ncbi:Nuclear envelope morphology protein 1 [Geranomyces michiganensis]|nr:Nuclear envelope morphology protein 1 [Geranomyces michiganensis]